MRPQSMPARIARYGDGLISSIIVIHLPQRRRRDRRERRDSLVERDGGLARLFVFVAAAEPSGGGSVRAAGARRAAPPTPAYVYTRIQLPRTRGGTRQIACSIH